MREIRSFLAGLLFILCVIVLAPLAMIHDAIEWFLLRCEPVVDCLEAIANDE